MQAKRRMNTYVALFRAINVVGRHILPMKDLNLLLEQQGCLDVRTYIQSGNAIFRIAAPDKAGLAKRLAGAVATRHGFQPRVLVLSRSELERAAAANPFPEAREDPKSLHLFFLTERPKKPDWKLFEALKKESERFELKGKVLYLHTPDGFGTSKLAARTEKLLGVEATARNWRTITTLIQMAGGAPKK